MYKLIWWLHKCETDSHQAPLTQCLCSVNLDIFALLPTLSILYRYKLSKLVTIAEGNLKAPFSIATTPRCSGGRYSFPWISPLTLEQYLLRTAHWLSDRVFANSLGDWGLISGQVIPKTQKVVLDTSLLNTQHYKECFKSKVKQSRERSSTLPYTLV